MTTDLASLLPALQDALGCRVDATDARDLVTALAADEDAWHALQRAVDARRETIEPREHWAPGMEDIDE